jgi:hypothetical protein
VRAWSWSLGGGAALVALTRVAALPDGPWEQDEAIFASALLDFDVPAHRPHPPGFPGWIGLGLLLRPLIGDPLRTLELLSCAASAASFVLLAWLLARAVPRPVALAAATLHAFVPTVWFHAPRALASTPAVALALAAVAGWVHGSRWGARLGWIALVWAGLTRPQLAPVLAALGLCAVVWLRGQPRALCKDLALAGGIGAAVAAAVVIDTGSLARLLRAMSEHFGANERARAGWPEALEDLGLVRGLGGVWAAGIWALATGIGLGLLARRRWWWAAAAGLVLAATLATLLLWHVPTHPRYQVPLAAVCAPLVAIAAARLGRVGGAALLFVGAGASAWVAAPAVWSVHTTPLPIVAALRAVSRPEGDAQALVYTHGAFSFPRLWSMTGALGRPAVDERELGRLGPTLTRPFLYMTAIEPLPGATVTARVFEEFPQKAWDLSQRRFLREWVVEGAVLTGEGVSRAEIDRGGERFAWLGPAVTLWAQPSAEGLGLALVVPQEVAPLTVTVTVEEAVRLRSTLAAGPQVLRAPTGCVSLCAVKIEFDKTITAAKDQRALSARLYGAWNEGPLFKTPAYTWSPGLPREAAARGVVFFGFYGPEKFLKGTRPGAWTTGLARAEFPAGPGRVGVTLANPPPRAGLVTLRSDLEARTVAVTGQPSTHWIAVGGAQGRAWIEIEGAVNVPAVADPTKKDTRPLGQTVLELRYEPE